MVYKCTAHDCSLTIPSNKCCCSDSVLVAVRCVFGEQCNRMSFCPTVASAGASTPLQAPTKSHPTGDMSQMAFGEFMHAL